MNILAKDRKRLPKGESLESKDDLYICLRRNIGYKGQVAAKFCFFYNINRCRQFTIYNLQIYDLFLQRDEHTEGTALTFYRLNGTVTTVFAGKVLTQLQTES